MLPNEIVAGNDNDDDDDVISGTAPSTRVVGGGVNDVGNANDDRGVPYGDDGREFDLESPGPDHTDDDRDGCVDPVCSDEMSECWSGEE